MEISVSSSVKMYCSDKDLTCDLYIAEPVSAPSSAPQQPIPFDASGDMKVSLLGFPVGDDKAENLKVWRNNWEESNQTQLFSLYAKCAPHASRTLLMGDMFAGLIHL